MTFRQSKQTFLAIRYGFVLGMHVCVCFGGKKKRGCARFPGAGVAAGGLPLKMVYKKGRKALQSEE